MFQRIRLLQHINSAVAKRLLLRHIKRHRQLQIRDVQIAKSSFQRPKITHARFNNFD